MRKKNTKKQEPALYQLLQGDMEKPISRAYSVLDNDLARDNLENDLPAADLEDL